MDKLVVDQIDVEVVVVVDVDKAGDEACAGRLVADEGVNVGERAVAVVVVQHVHVALDGAAASGRA